MQAIFDLLMSMTALLFAVAGLVVIHDLWVELEGRRSLGRGARVESPAPSRWKVSVVLAAVAWIPLLVALAMAVLTSGRVGIHTGEARTTQARTVARVQVSASQPARFSQPTKHR